MTTQQNLKDKATALGETINDNFIKKSSTTGLMKNDGTVDTTSYVSDVSGKADKTSGASQITDPNAHSNIGTSAGATQAQINTAIDSLIGSAITYIVGSGS